MEKFGFLEVSAFFVVFGMAGALVFSLPWVILARRDDNRTLRARDDLVRRLRNGDFRPSTVEGLLASLGKPDNLRAEEDNSGAAPTLVYYSGFELRRNTKGIAFVFKDGELDRVVDEDGNLLLLPQVESSIKQNEAKVK